MEDVGAVAAFAGADDRDYLLPWAVRRLDDG
jgi:hypothetical protein